MNFTIGFSTKKGFNPGSRLIRWCLGTPYSHVYIKFHSNFYDRDIVYQAGALEVNLLGSVRFNSEEILVDEFELPISEELQKSLVQYAIDTCGMPFGFLSCFGLGLYLIGKKLKISIPLWFQSDTSLFCSELVANVLKEILKLSPSIDPKSTTPLDIYSILKRVQQ